MHRSDQRRPKGYWSNDLILFELYNYLKTFKKDHNRPSIFMPRLSELTYNNHNDIRCAIDRFYGNDNNLCLETKTLVPFNEWNYFENQLLLFHSLKEYMQQNKLDNKYFPLLTNIRRTNPILFKYI